MITRIVNLFKIDVSGNRIFGLDLLRCAAIFFCSSYSFFRKYQT